MADKRPVNVMLDARHLEAARIIQERYGLGTRSDAIRFALMALASAGFTLDFMKKEEGCDGRQ